MQTLMSDCGHRLLELPNLPGQLRVLLHRLTESTPGRSLLVLLQILLVTSLFPTHIILIILIHNPSSASLVHTSLQLTAKRRTLRTKAFEPLHGVGELGRGVVMLCDLLFEIGSHGGLEGLVGDRVREREETFIRGVDNRGSGGRAVGGVSCVLLPSGPSVLFSTGHGASDG